MKTDPHAVTRLSETGHLTRRRWLQVALVQAAGAASGWGALQSAHAQAVTFPVRPLRIVVPFGAGGVADLTVRAVGQRLSEQLGQPVVVDNKPGAGGIAAAEAVARSEPDGHTLLLMSNGTAVSAGLFRTLPFDAQRDFAPLSTLGFFDLALLVPPQSPHRSAADLLAWVRAHPGKLNLGTINVGSTQHLAAELFKARTGLDLQVVPFNGTPALTQALRGGQVDAGIEILAPMMGQVKGGGLRALAVLGDTSPASMPQVPPLQNVGVPGYDVSSWNALAAPVRTPREVQQRLHREIQTALAHPDVQRRLSELDVQPRGSTPEQLAQLLATEIRRWSDVIQRAGVPRL